MKWAFSCAEYKTFLLRSRVFSRALCCGARRGLHHRASVGPGRAPWRVLWACKVAKSGEVTTGSLSATLEPTRPKETP